MKTNSIFSSVNAQIILTISVIASLGLLVIEYRTDPLTYEIAFNITSITKIYFWVLIYNRAIEILEIKLHPYVIWSITIAILYFWVTHYFPIPIDRYGTETASEIMTEQFLLSLPNIVALISQIILVIKIITSTISTPTYYGNLKAFAFAYLITLGLNISFPLTLVYFESMLEYQYEFLQIISLLPILALLSSEFKNSTTNNRQN